MDGSGFLLCQLKIIKECFFDLLYDCFPQSSYKIYFQYASVHNANLVLFKMNLFWLGICIWDHCSYCKQKSKQNLYILINLQKDN